MSYFDRLAEKNDLKCFGVQPKPKNPTKTTPAEPRSLLTCLDGKPEWANGGNHGSYGSGTNLIVAFDNHAIFYIFAFALVFSLCFAVPGADFLGLVLCLGTVVCMGYYTIKGLAITCKTASNWKRDNPGKSIFDLDGGLTSYDQNFADAIGRAVGQSCQGSNRSSSGLTSYDIAKAREIASNIRK
jgi:hypothetical protein